MSIQVILDGITDGKYTRDRLQKIRENALRKFKEGANEAREIVDAIDRIGPPKIEAQYAFLGFCPGADIERRQDEKMLKNGIYEFDFVSSETQLKRMGRIMAGDTIILKKREVFAETMRIYSHGPVTQVCESKFTGKPYFNVDWITPPEFLEVPLMGCNSTINIRELAHVEESMPKEFWDWLGWRP